MVRMKFPRVRLPERRVLLQLLQATTVGGSFALILAGIWGLLGWQWAAIAAGLPAFTFYLWGEIRTVPARPRHSEDT